MIRHEKPKHSHSLSMAKRDSHIHTLLSPIMETIRTHKINSFVQLRDKITAVPSYNDGPAPSYIFQPYATTGSSKLNMFKTARNNP